MLKNAYCLTALWIMLPSAANSRPAEGVTLASSLNPSVYGEAVAFTATVAPSTATGSVTFYDGITVLETEPLIRGQAKLNTSLLAPGARSIRAYYRGDATNSPSDSTALTQKVIPVEGSGFTSPLPVLPGGMPDWVATGDFNGDGKTDLAIADFLAVSVSVLLGNGDGTFQSAVSYPANYPSSISVGDFNGDGAADLAVTNTLGGIGVLLGNGDGTFRAVVSYKVGSAAFGRDFCCRGVVVGDFNRDGIADLVSLSGDGVFSVFIGKGDGTFATAVDYGTPLNVSTSFSIAMGDFNGDNAPDLAIVGPTTTTIQLNNGDGTFRQTVAYPTGDPNELGDSATELSVAVADFNGDGKTDLAILDYQAVLVLLGNGDGTFFQPFAPFFGVYLGTTLTTGDFNGDGHIDIAVAIDGGATAGSIGLLLGNGDGSFQAAGRYPIGHTPASVATGDFNGDGRADLAIANYSDSNISILLGATLSLSQTITFAPLSNVTFGVLPFAASATASSGLTVTFASSSSSVCTVSANAVTIVGPGICSIAASQAGDAKYAAAATVEQKFSVNVHPRPVRR
jgi:hypothetical protein